MEAASVVKSPVASRRPDHQLTFAKNMEAERVAQTALIGSTQEAAQKNTTVSVPPASNIYSRLISAPTGHEKSLTK
jgi:hypothetical protein